MIKNIYSVLLLLLETQVLMVIFMFISFLIEKITGFRLLIDHFLWAKSSRNAEIAADFHSALYFVFALVIFAINSYRKNIEPNAFIIITWLVFVISLTVLVRKLYSEYQRVDLSKSDDDYS